MSMTKSAAETRALGERLAAKLKPGEEQRYTVRVEVGRGVK